MKKLIIILFCFISLTSFAWERYSDTTIFISYSGGISFSSMKNFPAHEQRTGFGMRLNVEFKPSSEFLITGGFALSQYGYKYTSSLSDVLGNKFDTTINVAMQYIGVPVSVNYNLGRKFNPYIGVGFEPAIMISAREYAKLPETRNGIELNEHNINYMNQEYFKKFGFSVFAQGGIEYKLKQNISAFAEYKYSTMITKLYKQETIYGNNIKNKAWAVQVGLKWGIPITYKVY
ncbi:MAG: porin family protein [Bacteroidales bacterium]|nr:porin family protein [Bacteroidales bacterium]